jgi:hypothetical protein
MSPGQNQETSGPSPLFVLSHKTPDHFDSSAPVAGQVLDSIACCKWAETTVYRATTRMIGISGRTIGWMGTIAIPS